MREDHDRVTSYVFDGTKVVEVSGSITVMISDDDDLTALASKVKPGTIAYLAGWTQAWQLDTDNETWVVMIAAQEGE